MLPERYAPSRQNHELKRGLWVTKEISDVLTDKLVPAEFKNAEPLALSDAQIVRDNFSFGWLVTVSRQKPGKSAVIKQMHGADEVWTFCLRKISPGWRIIGRFLEQDCFVGVRIVPRSRIGMDGTKLFIECATEMDVKFAGLPCVRSDNLSHYLTGQYNDLDKDN